MLGHDALRMRLRRLCEVKPTGKTHVDEKTRAEYKEGGSKREVLEIALVESLKKWGTSTKVREKVKAFIFFSKGRGALVFMFGPIYTQNDQPQSDKPSALIVYYKFLSWSIYCDVPAPFNCLMAKMLPQDSSNL